MPCYLSLLAEMEQFKMWCYFKRLIEPPSQLVQHRKVPKRRCSTPTPTLNRYTRQKRCYKGVLKPSNSKKRIPRDSEN